MKVLNNLFINNREWAKRQREGDPEFFTRLSASQSPEYLWIGCSDSRVPANEIVDLPPGDLFVHRNVANVVVHTDLNCLAVIQYAVEVLKVRHIIVCGHYGCGGVHAAVRNDKLGLIDNWLRHVQDVYQRHTRLLESVSNPADPADLSGRIHLMCELNVIEQVVNVSQTTIVQDAWSRGQALTVHGWIYSLTDGLLQDVGMCVSDSREMADGYRAAIDSIEKKIQDRIM